METDGRPSLEAMPLLRFCRNENNVQLAFLQETSLRQQKSAERSTSATKHALEEIEQENFLKISRFQQVVKISSDICQLVGWSRV